MKRKKQVDKKKLAAFLLVAGVYFVLPDPILGPIDDALVFAAAFFAGTR